MFQSSRVTVLMKSNYSGLGVIFLIAKCKLYTTKVYSIFFNDTVLKINQSKVIKYADNFVKFFADKDYDKVERFLCGNITRFSEWFTEKELLLILKPSKTELLLFGTNRRMAKIPNNLKVIYNHSRISILEQN